MGSEHQDTDLLSQIRGTPRLYPLEAWGATDLGTRSVLLGRPPSYLSLAKRYHPFESALVSERLDFGEDLLVGMVLESDSASGAQAGTDTASLACRGFDVGPVGLRIDLRDVKGADPHAGQA